MRVTLDTGILVRAHQNAYGLARSLLIELLAHGHVMLLSGLLLDELERVLYYPRLLRRSKLRADQITDYLDFLSVASEIVEIDETAPAPIRDPNDAHILQTAVAGRADVICTLDTDFYERAVVEYCERHAIQVMRDLDLLRRIRGQAQKA